MRGTLRALGGLTAALVLLAAPVAALAALPKVSSGQRPGPPLLYAPAPSVPQLANAAPFTARPLLVSGTDAYRGGEYLYQDYLFDDRGADTAPGLGSRPDNQGSGDFSPTAGDVQYPTDPKYANNAADLVEFRIKPTRTAILYRVTLNSLADEDDTVVGIGIDTDRSGGAAVAWPNGAGVSSPGLDRFITAWGTGGELTSLPGNASTPLPPGAVKLNTRRRQMTIRVPRTRLDPKQATWRYVAGTGLWDSSANNWLGVATAEAPTSTAPASGSSLVGAPAVFNLAFRFDEPRVKQPNNPPFPYTTAPGTGNWMEDKQAHVLGAMGGASTGPGQAGGQSFHADVNFAKLARKTNRKIHAPAPTQVRIAPSGAGLHEGVQPSFPEYGGRLQPYMIRVPPGYKGKATGMTFALHSLGGNYNQFAVFSPHQLTQFGDERDNLVVTSEGHGPDGWYTDEAESDVFEVWADVNRHFNLDPNRTYLSGYSMGGYGTYKLGVEYPDLFAKAFTTVGPPGEGIWIPPGDPTSGPETLTNDLLENVRWLPYLNWAGSSDELVPVAGVVAQQSRFDELGLRSKTLIFSPADHFALAIADQWAAARDFLGDAKRTKDPDRVDYGFFPAADRPALGLRHDHSYWVSRLRARDTSAGDRAIARISARSLVNGKGNPVTAQDDGAGADAGPPMSYTAQGTKWTGFAKARKANRLDLALTNVRTARLDGRRAGLRARRRLKVKIVTDGATHVRLAMKLPADVKVRRLGAKASAAAAKQVRVSRRGVTFNLRGQATRTYVLKFPKRRS